MKILLIEVKLKEGQTVTDLLNNQHLAHRVDVLAETENASAGSHRFIRRIKTLRNMFHGFLSLRDAKRWVENAYYNSGKGDVK